MTVETALILFSIWCLCGIVAYIWVRSLQEHDSYWSEHELEWISVYRSPSPQMLRGRIYFALLGPVGLFLIALTVVDEH